MTPDAASGGTADTLSEDSFPGSGEPGARPVTLRMMIAALALAGIFVATYLTLYKVGAIGELSCSVGSCETVNTSRWATLLGVPVAAWGILFYVVAFATALAGTQPRRSSSVSIARFLTGWSAGGVLFSAWLTYLELFVIHAICIWCVTSAVMVTVIFLLSAADLRALGRSARPA